MSMQEVQAEKIDEGLSSQNVANSLPPSLTCQLCSDLIKEAKTTRCCRTSFCSSCIEEVFLSFEYPICPGAGCCDKTLNINELDENDELCKLAQQWFLKKSTIAHEMPTTTRTCDTTASLDSGSNNPSMSAQGESSNTSQVRDDLPFAVPAPPPVQVDDSTREFYQIVSQANNKSCTFPIDPAVLMKEAAPTKIDVKKALISSAFLSYASLSAPSLFPKRKETEGETGLSLDHNSHVPSIILPADVLQSKNFEHPRIQNDHDDEKPTPIPAVLPFDRYLPPAFRSRKTMGNHDRVVYLLRFRDRFPEAFNFDRPQFGRFMADPPTSEQFNERSYEPTRYRKRNAGSSPSRNNRPERRWNQQCDDFGRDKKRGRVETIVIDSDDEEVQFIKTVIHSKGGAKEKGNVDVKENKINVEVKKDEEEEGADEYYESDN